MSFINVHWAQQIQRKIQVTFCKIILKKGSGEKYLRLKCDYRNDTSFSTKSVSLTRTFSMLIWIKPMGCNLYDRPIKTIIFKGDRFVLNYNLTSQKYMVDIRNEIFQNTKYSDENKIVYNKWVNLAVVNSKTDGLRLIKNAEDILIQGEYKEIIDNLDGMIFLGSTDVPIINRFDGYIRFFQLFDGSLDTTKIKYAMTNIKLEIDLLHVSTILYYDLGGSAKELQNFNSPDYEWTDSDPVCDNTAESGLGICVYDGVSSSPIGNPQYQYFNGDYGYKFERIGDYSDSITVSFWFKFIKTPRTKSASLLFEIEEVFKIMLNRNIGTDNSQLDYAEIEVSRYLDVQKCTAKIARHENYWNHVVAGIQGGNIKLWIDNGYFFEKLLNENRLDTVCTIDTNTPYLVNELVIYVGGKSSTEYFTGFIKEFIILSDSYSAQFSTLSRMKYFL